MSGVLSRKRLLAALAVIVLLAGGFALYRLFAAPVLRVRAAVTPSFQLRQDWRKLLEARFAAVSSLYSTVGGPRFEIADVREWACMPAVEGLDSCRKRLRDLLTPGNYDVIIGFVSQDNPARRASMVPFSRTAVIVDSATDSEEQNRRILAHELAHLFGAAHLPPADPPGLLSEKPANDRIDPRTAGLLHDVRGFDFRGGLERLDPAEETKLVRALAKANEGMSGKPEARARRVLGGGLLSDGHLTAAIHQYKLAVDADPQDLAGRMELASAYSADHQAEPAAEQVRYVLKAKPDFPGAVPNFAALLVQSGHAEEAIDVLDRALATDPKNVLLLLLKGTTLAGQIGRIDEAISLLQNVVEIAPNSNDAVRNLARVQAMKQQLGEAAKTQADVAHAHPADPKAQYNYGVALARLGKIGEAAAMFRKTIDISPKFGEAHANLATMLYLQKQYGAAYAEAASAQSLGVKVSPALMEKLTALNSSASR